MPASLDCEDTLALLERFDQSGPSLDSLDSRLADGLLLANMRDAQGRTAMHLACAVGSIDAVRLLQRYGFSLAERDFFGMSPIVYAASMGRNTLLHTLRADRGLDVEPPARVAAAPARSAGAEDATFEARSHGYLMPCLYFGFLLLFELIFFLDASAKSPSVLADRAMAVLTIAQLTCYGLSARMDPGYVTSAVSSKLVQSGAFCEFCDRCQLWRPARSHHCRTCKRCVMLFDHHCGWTDNCVGVRNLGWFISYLILCLACIGLLALSCVNAILASASSRGLSLSQPIVFVVSICKHHPYLVFALILAPAFGSWIASMLGDQVRSSTNPDQRASAHVRLTDNRACMTPGPRCADSFAIRPCMKLRTSSTTRLSTVAFVRTSTDRSGAMQPHAAAGRHGPRGSRSKRLSVCCDATSRLWWPCDGCCCC